MTSIDIEIFRSELDDLKFYIDERISQTEKNLRAEIQTLHDNVLVNSAKIDAQRDFMSFGFTIMAVVIAIVGFVITLAPMFRDIYKDAKQARRDNVLTTEKVQSMIDSSIAEALHLSAHKKG